MSDCLVVPVDVQAFCVGRPDVDPNNPHNTATFARLAPDFSILPVPGGAAVANLSELVLPEPFAQIGTADAMQPGVHLHWALPDALVRGAGDPTGDGTVAFPAVPNRWLVVRLLVVPPAAPGSGAGSGPTAGGPESGTGVGAGAGSATLTSVAWVIESDREWFGDPASARDAASRTAPITPDPVTMRPYVKVGRVFDLAGWSEDPTATFIARHNALGFGATEYAATYETSTNVFTFHDDFSDLAPAAITSGAEVGYLVAGWYRDPADDPVARLSSAADATVATLVAGLESGYRWTTALQADPPGGLPTALVCSGMIDGIVWNPATGYVSVPTPQDAPAVAVGNNRIEALSAWLAAQPMLAAMPAIEPLLATLQAGLLVDWATDLVSIEERLHALQFAARRGGTIWQIQSTRRDPDGVTRAVDPPTVPPVLPDGLGRRLNELNIAQAALDRAEDAIVSRRQQVFADWTKFMRLTYPPPGGVGAAVAIEPDDVRAFICSALAELNDRLAERDATLRPAVATLAAAMTTSLLASVIESLELVQIDGDRYWTPTDPVVLLAGPYADPHDRHGGDGRFTDAGYLVCRATSMLAESVSITLGGVRVAVHAADLPAPAGLAPGHDGPVDTLRALIGQASLTLPVAAPVIAAALIAAIDPNAADPVPDADTLAATLAAADSAWLTGAPATGAPATAGPSFAGTSPSPVGYCRWAGNPWIPLLLQWRVALQPQVAAGAGLAYLPDMLTRSYRLDDDEIDLTPATTALAGSGTIEVYSGTIGLAGRVDINLQRQVSTYLASYPAEAIDPEPRQVLEALGGVKVPMLAQALGGLREAVRMRHQILQLPVSDPLALADGPGASSFSNIDVPAAVADQNALAALPDSAYNPITAGSMTVLALRLVDAFGQVRDIDVTGEPPIRAAAMRPTVDPPGARPLLMRPRFAQPARLSLRWLSAGDDEVEMNTDPATSPICGWMLFNHLDASLMIYNAAGTTLGAFNTRGAFWQGAPGNAATYDRSLDEVLATANTHLGDVARGIARATEPLAFLTDLLRVIDTTTTLIEPRDAHHHRGTSVLFGQPLAIVRARLDLELQGLAAIDESWQALANAIAGGASPSSRPDAGFPDVNVPVRLGDITDLSDGLIGYFLEDGTPGAFGRFYAPAASARSTTGVVNPVTRPVTVTARDGSRQVIVTMLIDPRAAVHATTGILPVTSVAIPPPMYADALRRMSVVFLVAPLMTSALRTVVPLPTEPGATWSWISRGDDGWAVTDVAAPNPADAFGQPPQTLLEGWVALTPDPPLPPSPGASHD